MRILFATDGSRPADRARDLIAASSWPADSMIRVVGVVPYRWSYGGPDEGLGFAMPGDGSADHVGDRRAADLDETVRVLAAAQPGTAVDRALLSGRVPTEIVEEAARFEADLIVVGHRGYGPWESMLLGSVSAEVVDHATCPVLVVRDARLGPVVVADDGSEAARAAVDAIAGWPMLAGRPISVVSVADTGFPYMTAVAPGLYGESLMAYEESSKAIREESRATAETGAARFREAGLEADAVVRDGGPAREIVELAREIGAGLVVVGTRGHTGVARFVLGSTARNVLLHAPCSVLVVRGVGAESAKRRDAKRSDAAGAPVGSA